jgi:hypothetical protein
LSTNRRLKIAEGAQSPEEERVINKNLTGALALAFCATSMAVADTKVAAKYTSDGQTTETTVYSKGDRLRYEYAEGLTLIRQCDQKRLVQIDDKSKTFLTLPAEQPDAAGAPQPALTDTGERKLMFGLAARHLKIAQTVEGKKTETDGWYADLKDSGSCAQPDAGSSHRGFPLAYTTTTYGENGKPSSTFAMSVTSVATAPLEAALFEVPAGYTNSAPQTAERKPAHKASGEIRIGVVALPNKPNLQNQSARPYEHLVAQLQDAKFDVVPLADGTPEAITQKAQEWQCDYILYNEPAAVDQPATAANKVGRFLHHAPGIGRVTGGDVTQARVDYRLVPLSGGSPISSSVTGKTGGQFNWKAAAMLASNVVPMAMAAKMVSGKGMMNPVMMKALLSSGNGAGAPMMGMDPMMSGMSMLLGGANVMPGAGMQNFVPGMPGMPGNAAPNPTAFDTAVAAAFDQEVTAIIAQLKPAAK